MKTVSQSGYNHHFSVLEFFLKLLDRKNTILEKGLTSDVDLSKSQQQNKSEFLSSITHELKTPLSAIISFADLLKENLDKISKISAEKNINDGNFEEEITDKKHRNATDKPEETSNKNYRNFTDQTEESEILAESRDLVNEINLIATDMNELIHDLLDVGSIVSGNFSVDLSKEIEIKNLIKRSVKLNYDYSLARRVLIKTEIADDVSTIKLDMKRMKQILTNLISNAIKYSPEHSEVKITVRNITGDSVANQLSQKKSESLIPSASQTLEIIISDQGFGMTESQIKIAFEKYQTIENPNSGKVDSFGLGLPITKQLVELQHGTIEVRSKPGNGTEMILRFPYDTKLKT